MRSLGFALLAVSLTSCTQPAPEVEAPYDDFETDEDSDDSADEPADDGVVLRDAGKRDAGRDAGRRGLDASPFPGDFPPLFDAGFAADAALPPPQRLSFVLKSERPLPALSGGTLAVRGGGDIAVAADPDRDRIYVIKLDGNQLPKVIELEAGSEPGRVALDSRGRAHVALRSAGQVVTIELATGSVLARSAVCALPRGLAYDEVQDALVVACAGGELVTLGAGTHQALANVQLALDLRDVVIDPDGTRLVSRYRSAELLRISATGQLLSKSAPNPSTETLGNDLRVGPTGEIIDKGPLVVSSSPSLAWRTVASSDDRVLMLHQQSRDSEIDLGADGAQGASYGGGCSTITTAAVTEFAADGRVTASAQLAPHGLVVDVAASPDGRWVALAEPGGYLRSLGTLEIIDRSQINLGDPNFAGTAGLSPRTCVAGWTTGANAQISAVAYDDSGKLYALSREPASLHVYGSVDANIGINIVPQREVALSLESVRDTGHELFHADVGGGLACASCHGEGLDDGHVWNFKGFGARRTQTMRGGLLSTLPLHWEGDLPTFQSLIDEVMTRRMGGFVVEAKYSEALAQWLDGLPPLKLQRPEDAAALRGKTLFESAEVGCATCHSGTHFTNNQSADVGTGGPFQVPTLLGLALHPPFMHDGCAATLEARFDPNCGGGDAHGHTSQLTLAEIGDLVSYLKTL